MVRRWGDGALWVHASPRRPINEYIFPDDVLQAPGKMDAIFDRIQTRCFCGHTHVTGVFTDEPDFYPPADLGGTYQFTDDEKCIVNPGSVGQPRDRDPRSSFAVVYEEGEAGDDGETGPARVEFVRVAYDIQAVIRKVEQVPDLSDFLGLRLLEWR